MSFRRPPGTFSIVACDPERKFWGVTVATMPMSVGGVVPWAEWRVGALATQAQTNYTYGPNGLAGLRRGASASELIRSLTRSDPKRDQRQLGVVDRSGRSAAWTGKRCMDWAGHLVGEGFSCQGNLLKGDRVVPAMVAAFEAKRGSLARRLYAALVAGAAEGGDRRGIQSAALLVVHREPWFEATWSDRWVDLRVDQHPRPVRELGRILALDERGTRQFLAARAARLRKRRAARGRKRSG